MLETSSHLTLRLAITLFSLTIILGGCSKKPASIQDGKSNGGELKQPQVAAFDPELQNDIFMSILNESTGGNCKGPEAAKPEARLLTAQEYIQDVQSAFGISLGSDELQALLPVETTVLGYNHLRQFNILSPEKLESYMNANRRVAAAVAEQAGTILNCGQDSQECVGRWLAEKLPQLWRRSISDDIVQQEVSTFATYGSNEEAFEQLVQRLLLSPYFIFRRQLGLQGSLDSWEVASLLADSLWAAPVSEDLKQKAEQGSLISKEQVRSQALTMINDPKFYQGVKRFAQSWLTTKVIDAKDFASTNQNQIDDNIKQQLQEESANFLYQLVQSEQDQFANIFEANYTVGSQQLAQVYGFTADGQDIQGLPDGVQKLAYPEGRLGIISQPSVAISASNLEKTNPALRGKHILEKFLCHNLETPENIADVVANTQFDQNVSVVEAFDKATNFGSCGECHRFVNGVGFGMENISPAGFFQDIDNHQKPVVADGELVSLTGTTTPFNGISGLSQALASSKDVEVCLAVQAFRMVYGRLEEKRDVCTIVDAYQKASQEELKFHELFVELLIQRSSGNP
ncbi:DUF1592 domain-containing protein [Pseudobacteriovorax antillogorgiicola]|uniref:DUF1592 domain-containing protein n=1 Tax=Pseudobacteriovorax antillogorgiicola TaxID=1513793 RepID=A0A1Y6BML9_9BACT|nr:DUF1592 domain-containing protein [Pseudobacteriovorax antillogorgiicola]TCS55515.1 uncharacterized protein DUF1587 [Pseudobacteriovorax antillogorgiicola]SMF11425.1 Protein of unknown function [Pseudobacteriovorax antillogorgiicola]